MLPALELHRHGEVDGVAPPCPDETEDGEEADHAQALGRRSPAATPDGGAGRLDGDGWTARGDHPGSMGRSGCQPRYKLADGDGHARCNRARRRCTLPSPSCHDPTRGMSNMPRIVRGALVQASWTGDKESMIQKHEERAHEAAKQGAQVILFQELFYGPYFCQVQDAQYYSYTELIPDGPTTKRMQDLAKQTGMVVIAPMYEEDAQASGIYYNTAAVIDADGTYLGKYRKTHIPHVKGFWEKFYFRPGNLGYPVFETAVGKVGVYICYDRHFPEGARALGLNGAEMVFIPSATSRGLSEYLWRIEQPSHAVANGYYVGTINRVGIEKEFGDDDFYGQSYFVDPRGQFVGEVGDAHEEELIVRDLDLDKIAEVRNTWQFYRDRRPDAYEDLTRP
jgi:N-carbamoylputrescine amidase